MRGSARTQRVCGTVLVQGRTLPREGQRRPLSSIIITTTGRRTLS